VHLTSRAPPLWGGVRPPLAGDTMFGGGVAERLATDPSASLVATEIASAFREADVMLLNLKCCISDRGATLAGPGQALLLPGPSTGGGVLSAGLDHVVGPIDEGAMRLKGRETHARPVDGDQPDAPRPGRLVAEALLDPRSRPAVEVEEGPAPGIAPFRISQSAAVSKSAPPVGTVFHRGKTSACTLVNRKKKYCR
jgi:hypothetical protein